MPGLDPRVARCALTLGYLMSRLQRETPLSSLTYDCAGRIAS